MTAPRRRILIDDRPCGPHGPWAAMHLSGTTLLDRLREQAAAVGGASVETKIVPGSGDFVLRTDRLYDVGRLQRAYRKGQDAERAVVWRLDTEASWNVAGDEMARRASYQPLGRYWAWRPSREIARRLAPTWIRPNGVTCAAALAFLAATWIVGLGFTSVGGRFAAASLLAVALVLDTADGHLARLQGTCSEFGRWLDAVLDELCDVALHAAIAWACFVRDVWGGWLLFGIAYAGGKHVFQVGQTAGKAGGEGDVTSVAEPRFGVRSLVRLAGHADVRWHLWIALALIGRLEWALIAYAPYYPARVVASAFSRRRRDG